MVIQVGKYGRYKNKTSVKNKLVSTKNLIHTLAVGEIITWDSCMKTCKEIDKILNRLN